MCDAANPLWGVQQAAYAATVAAAAARAVDEDAAARAEAAASARRDALMQDLEDDFAESSGDEQPGASRLSDGAAATVEPCAATPDRGGSADTRLRPAPLTVLQRRRAHSGGDGLCHVRFQYAALLALRSYTLGHASLQLFPLLRALY
jgi:hypothetical protein